MFNVTWVPGCRIGGVVSSTWELRQEIEFSSGHVILLKDRESGGSSKVFAQSSFTLAHPSFHTAVNLISLAR